MGEPGVRSIARGAVEQLAELTGRPPDGVSAARRTEEGWRLEIDVVEVERIPASTSVLATYQVELDPGGNLLSYERVRRYHRNATDGDRA